MWPHHNSRLQKGPAERGHVKKRQKSSKSVKKFFGTFRQFSCRAKNVKNRQKVSKSFSTIFARLHFSGPFWGGSDRNVSKELPQGLQEEEAWGSHPKACKMSIRMCLLSLRLKQPPTPLAMLRRSFWCANPRAFL